MPNTMGLAQKICSTHTIMGFPCGSGGKESICNAGDLGLIPGLGRSPGEGKGYPLQYSGLENSMGCIAYGVAKSQTRLSKFHFTSHNKDSVAVIIALQKSNFLRVNVHDILASEKKQSGKNICSMIPWGKNTKQ